MGPLIVAPAFTWDEFEITEALLPTRPPILAVPLTAPFAVDDVIELEVVDELEEPVDKAPEEVAFASTMVWLTVITDTKPTSPPRSSPLPSTAPLAVESVIVL